jgi:hypothetical protein
VQSLEQLQVHCPNVPSLRNLFNQRAFAEGWLRNPHHVWPFSQNPVRNRTSLPAAEKSPPVPAMIPS